MENKEHYNIYDFDITDIVSEKILFLNSVKKIKENLIEHTHSEILHDIKVNKKEKSIIVFIGLIVKKKDSEDNFIEIHYSFHYKLKNQENYNQKKFEKINRELAFNFFGISFSTFRGLCFSEFKNSTYNNVMPLNIINPALLLKGFESKEEKTTMTTEEKLTELTESCKQDYVNRYNKENHVENVLLVAEIQETLAEKLKEISESEEHSQLIKDLHKEFIDFSTNY